MHKVFEFISEIVGWLWIVISPLLIGLITGLFIYFANPTSLRLLIAVSITILGLVIGILWANNAWKRKGTVWFLSRVMASPELDDPEVEGRINNSDQQKEKDTLAKAQRRRGAENNE